MVASPSENGSQAVTNWCAEVRNEREAEGDQHQHHRGEDRGHRAEPILPETGRIFDAVGAAQDVAQRLDEARRGPQADDRAEPEQAARAPVEHLGDRLGEHFAHFRGQAREDVDDGELALLAAAAEQSRDRGGKDQEREQRDQRHVGDIAGVDEAILIHPQPDALEHDHQRRAAAQALDQPIAPARMRLRQSLAPFLGR